MEMDLASLVEVALYWESWTYLILDGLSLFVDEYCSFISGDELSPLPTYELSQLFRTIFLVFCIRFFNYQHSLIKCFCSLVQEREFFIFLLLFPYDIHCTVMNPLVDQKS